MKKKWSLMGVMIAMTTLLSTVAFGATLNVGSGQQYTTIGGALDAAADYDVVVIHGGYHTEDELTVAQIRGLTIRANSASQKPTIRANNSGCLAAYLCDDLTLENLEFDQGNALGNGSGNPVQEHCGGAVFFYQCDNVQILDCEMTRNVAYRGGGICAIDSEVLVSGTTIFNNSTTGSGGGIYLHHSQLVGQLLNINGNDSQYNGGGIVCDEYSFVSFQSGEIGSNTATDFGGGIYVGNGSVISICNTAILYLDNAAPVGPQGFILTADGDALVGNGTPIFAPSAWAGDHAPIVDPLVNCPLIATYPDYPEPLSVMIQPDGGGNCFNDAYIQGGVGMGDASIRVYGLTPNTDREWLWLEFDGNETTSFCLNSISQPYAHPDADADAFGRAVFRLPAHGGGVAAPGTKIWVNTAVQGQIRNREMDIHFNSPDITGNRVVDLSDFATYLYVVEELGYHYACDFNWDGVLNLADHVLLANAMCASCAYPVTPPTCE